MCLTLRYPNHEHYVTQFIFVGNKDYIRFNFCLFDTIRGHVFKVMTLRVEIPEVVMCSVPFCSQSNHSVFGLITLTEKVTVKFTV